MNLEKKLSPKIKGYKLINSKEFYNLKINEGIRLFDYSNNCVQYFYKKKGNVVKTS